MEENSTPTPDAQVQEESGKIGKLFEANMKKLIAVLNGESLLKTTKISGDATLTEAVALIAKEEKEAKVAEFVEKTRALIKSKRDFDTFQKQKRKEFDKAVEDKQKVFNEEAKNLFALIENIKDIEQSYLDTMSGK